MADAAWDPPHQRCPAATRSQAMLERVAASLPLPVTAPVQSPAGDAEAMTQAVDLLTAFMQIEGYDARRTCLAFVRAMARP